jgi:hypothetical protein
VACSSAIGGEFDVTIITENLAKTGFLKKNHGSFSVRKQRRPIEPLPERSASEAYQGTRVAKHSKAKR